MSKTYVAGIIIFVPYLILGQISFTAHDITTDADWANSVYAVDVDGDGDMDALSSSGVDSKIAWYENDGSESFTEHVISTSAGSANSVYAVDVDGDGDMDALSSSANDDKIAWYENDGSESFTEHVISTSADAAHDVHATDVDGDGDMDVLSASRYDDKIAWYENDGRESFTEHVISTSADVANSVYAADIDADGDMDVLSASRDDDKIAWYENDGSESFTEHAISTTADIAMSVYAEDIDGDGDIDVLSASYNDDTIAWYENNGSGIFTAHAISISADGAYCVYAEDVDGDGDMDILSASAKAGKISWYENDGSESFTENSVSTSANDANTRHVYAADVDNDGDMDLLAAIEYDNKIAWYENSAMSETMSVTVLEPNGGEKWNEDAPHEIKWATTDSAAVKNVKIEYSTDNGSSYNTITDSTENNGHFEWFVYRNPGSNHKVRITVSDESGNKASDESDEIFTVLDVDTYIAEAGELRMTIRNDGWTGWRTNIAAGEPHMEYPTGSENYHLYNSKLVIAYTRSDLDTVGTNVYDDDYAPASSMIIEDWADHLLLNSTYTYKWNNDLLVHQRVLVPKTSGDFIIYIYTLENTTTKIINDLYVGSYNDFDINDWTKNMTGFDSSNRLAYMYDESSDGYTSYAGVAMLTRTPVFHRWISGTDPLKGGPMYLRMADRTNDVTSDDQAGDYRIMLHTDKVFLAPGAKYAIVVTLLAGEGLAGIQSAAKSAVAFWNALNLDLTGEVTTPQKFTLHPNYPNPFNPSTTISYDLPEQAQITLEIYDLLGKRIKTLVNQSQDAGNKIVMWDGTDDLGRQVSAGVYLYRIQAGQFTQTRKMLFLK